MLVLDSLKTAHREAYFIQSGGALCKNELKDEVHHLLVHILKVYA